MPFTLGQRWISDTENELGLGTVVAQDARVVTLLFSASGKNRLYARSDAPITRVMFNPGDTVTSHEGWQLLIDAVEEKEGLLTYIGTRLDNGETHCALREVLLDSKLTFSKPQDRLFAGQIDRMDRFALRYRARKFDNEQFRAAWNGLRGIRASLIPHQLHIAAEVGQRHAPRVLLADEVGLGKTIEAGMIIHQQLLTGRAERVLIVVPESLLHQWLVEMLRRFNLHFSIFDDERYRQSLHDSDNPFETEQWVLCSLDFVRRNKERLAHLVEAPWDMLVVDEAHHLVWSETAPSREYQVIEQLAQHIPSVLLLTATPEQLGMHSHFARLRLLDPNRFHDYQAFVDEQQRYRPVADTVTLLLNGEPLDAAAMALLAGMLSGQHADTLLARINEKGAAADDARRRLTAMLMDSHGTSRVMFRNTRQGVKGFPARRLHAHALPLPAQYQTALKVAGIMDSEQAPEERARHRLYPERIFQQFEGHNATWWNFDPRVQWLVDFLLEQRQEKVLVICAHADTALQLEQVLREREGIRAAVFHEGLSLVDRDRAAAYFASAEDGAQVLLCSEIGSEGRNFQFASQMVMFDLPLNPDLLEQRIGRLDRIGQGRDIQIHVPYLEHSMQAVLLRWYHEGLDAFEHTCPTGRTLYDEAYQTLLGYLAEPGELTDFTAFLHDCRARHDALKAQMEQGRDRLLELHSNGGEPALALAQTLAEQDNDRQLVNFALNLFDIIGLAQEDRSDNLIVLKPSDHMLVPDFPGVPEEGCTITFNRDQALAREETQFISWEHPIIRNGLDLVLSSESGNSALSLLKNKALPVGTLLLELIYVVESQAPRNLQLNRFLPATPLRLLLDKNGTNLAPQVEFEQFNRQLNAVKRHTASKLVGAVQREVHGMLMRGEPLVAQQARALIDDARAQADQRLGAELSRLQALRRVNPAIRDDELEAVAENRRQVLKHLDEASWRLDAIRLIVVTHQ